MNLKELEIKFNEEKLVLNNQRALYWPSEKALLLADIHLGKAAHFRKNGIAIPTQVAQTDLTILEKLLQYYKPEKLIIVGDFVHAKSNAEIANFATIKTKYPTTTLILIKGNHDRLSDAYFHSLGMDIIVDELNIKDIQLVHHSELEQKLPSISGHVHPGVQLHFGKTKKSLPCFVLDENHLILPAFSQFTGLDTKNYYSDEVRYYAFTDKEMVQV